MKRKSSDLAVCLALLVLLAAEPMTGLCRSSRSLLTQTVTTGNPEQKHGDESDEEPLPQDRQDRAARLAKNARYDGGRCNLTKLTDDQPCFFDITEPWYLPLIPWDKSTIIFVGQASRVQSYLSKDETRIYTETTFHVEDLLKAPTTFTLPSERALVIDRIGGAIRTHSGQVLRDDTRDGFLGRPQVSMRYLLFADSTHGGKDFSMLRGYELRDGKVFRLTEDGSPSTVLVSEFPQEEKFLQAIRAGAK